MTISVPVFFAVVLIVIAMLLPSFVAVLAILLTDRKPSYLQTFLMTSLWLIAVAVYFGAAFVLPWSTMDPDNGTVGAGLGIAVTAILHIILAITAGRKLSSANYSAAWLYSQSESPRKTRIH